MEITKLRNTCLGKIPVYRFSCLPVVTSIEISISPKSRQVSNSSREGVDALRVIGAGSTLTVYSSLLFWCHIKITSLSMWNAAMWSNSFSFFVCFATGSATIFKHMLKIMTAALVSLANAFRWAPGRNRTRFWKICFAASGQLVHRLWTPNHPDPSEGYRMKPIPKPWSLLDMELRLLKPTWNVERRSIPTSVPS